MGSAGLSPQASLPLLQYLRRDYTRGLDFQRHARGADCVQYKHHHALSPGADAELSRVGEYQREEAPWPMYVLAGRLLWGRELRRWKCVDGADRRLLGSSAADRGGRNRLVQCTVL